MGKMTPKPIRLVRKCPKISRLNRAGLTGKGSIVRPYPLVSGDSDSFGKEALDTLMKEMEVGAFTRPLLGSP
jgi:hypothetical protein